MVSMRQERIGRRAPGMTAAALAGVRVVVAAIAGLVLMLSALVLGVVIGTGVLLWKLLGGRPSRVAQFGWRGARTRSRPRATQDDVVDVEVREVTRSTPQR
jgi:hypothetical protein